MTTTDPQVQNAFIDAKDPNLTIEIMLLGLKNRIAVSYTHLRAHET